MSKSFQLVNPTGLVSNISWAYLVDEALLQKFESKYKSLSATKKSQLKVSQAEIDQALSVLRSAPKIPISELKAWLDGMDNVPRATECWSQGLYAWPVCSNWTRHQAPPQQTLTDLSFERVSQAWANMDQVMDAYKLLLDVTPLMWKNPAFVVFAESAPDMDMNMFSTTKNMVKKIKSGSVRVEDLSPVDDVLGAKTHVVYVVTEEGEGYLNAERRLCSLSTAMQFRTLKDSRRAGEMATNTGGVFQVVELSVSVGKRVHISGTDTDSLLSQALCLKDAQEISSFIDADPATPQSRRTSKL